LQENYFGEDQLVTDFADSRGDHQEDTDALNAHINTPGEVTELDVFDPRLYRPFAVTVSVTLHDIQAHLVKVGCQFFAIVQPKESNKKQKKEKQTNKPKKLSRCIYGQKCLKVSIKAMMAGIHPPVVRLSLLRI
jgi:hypothetical protein